MHLCGQEPAWHYINESTKVQNTHTHTHTHTQHTHTHNTHTHNNLSVIMRIIIETEIRIRENVTERSTPSTWKSTRET